MTNNRISNKETRVARSKSKKTPLYKKYWVWLVIILAFYLIIRLFNTEVPDQIVGEPIEQEKEEKMNEAEKETINSTESTNEERGNISSETDYEDFMGTYVTFEGEPYSSPLVSMSSNIIVLGDAYYRSFNRWDLDMTSKILDTTIEGNVLTLHVDSHDDEVWGLHSESGMEQFTLDVEGETKVIYKKGSDDSAYYSMSSEDLQTHYNQREIDYARIMMTINGVPSLDSWAVAKQENDNQNSIVKVSHQKPTDASYSEDVTYLSSTAQGINDGVITYSVIRNGYIKIYDDEKSTKEIYIEPFEPYEVADFIENVEFIYE